MALGRTTIAALEAAGWEPRKELSQGAMDELENVAQTAISLFSAVNEIYEAFYQPETERWMLITDGGSTFKVNAPGLLIASPNPHRLDTQNPTYREATMIFTIGLDDKTVGSWLVWVGTQNNYPQRRPDMGFDYVS